MRITNFRKLSEKGDSIVEVLIAIAVISLVMGGAFVMTNRSLQGSRDAQERVNASKLVESQVEQIKHLSSASPATLFGSSAPASYCITSAGAVATSTSAACLVNISGNPTTGQPSFRLSVTRSGNTFTIRNAWTSVRGNVQNNVEMKYRAYQ